MTRIFCCLIILSSVCTACTQHYVDDPEELGKYAFKALTEIGRLDKEAYLEYFMTVDDMQRISDNEKVVADEKTRASMKKIEPGPWNARVFKDYDRIRAFGESEGIDWASINYEGFSFETITIDGLQACKGDMYFSYKKQTYIADVYSVFNGKEYRLVELEDLKRE